MIDDAARNLARRSTLRHPSGLTFNTPLLVPSFSSKGFRVTKDSSEVRDVLEVASEWLTETMLVSAYDLYHQHIPQPEALTATPELIILDSGGYEKRVEHDMSTSVHMPHKPRDWDLGKFEETLNRWPDRFPAVFVSYDDPEIHLSLQQQVKEATTILLKYPAHLHAFLLKPESADHTDLTDVIDTICNSPHCLAEFNIVGVTEKELGNSILDRMHNIARLRLGLDSGGLKIPLHVFGALDPITCVLYFLAGAEIFDGLTWLRFAFHEGLCVYRANYGALAVGVGDAESLVLARSLVDNVHYLRRLTAQMERFLLDRDFRKFEFYSDFFASEYDSLRVRLKGGSL